MTALRVRALTLVAVPLVFAACGRIGYDRLPAGGPAGSPGAGTGGSGPGGFFGGGGHGGGSGWGGGGDGGSWGNGGNWGNGGAGGDLTPPNDAGGPPASCTQMGNITRAWSFDSNMESWELSGTGTMIWTGAVGDPTPGALQIEWNSGQTIHPRLVQNLGNLARKVLTAEVWLDSGANVAVKLFVQTGTRLVWADGGVVTPTAGQWTCLAIDMDNPVFSRQQFDPTDVRIVGLEVAGSGASRIYLDEVAY